MNDNTVEQWMDKPYWVIDVLPKQVPLGSRGQYFKVEKYFLNHQQRAARGDKYAEILVRLNCYADLDVSTDGDNWGHNPPPEELFELVHNCTTDNQTLFILVAEGETLMTMNGDETYMTIYNPNNELLELLRVLATAHGLFLWRPPV